MPTNKCPLTRKLPVIFAIVLPCFLAACSDGSGSPLNPNPPAQDQAWYILPPGNYGGPPPFLNDNSLDQLPLYDALTPLRRDITQADIEALFLPEDFEPIGETTEEPTGRPGLTILYDEFGVAHISGDTREDLAFGAGWVTMRDRELLVQLGIGPARVAVADVPNIDAFGLVTSAQTFIPSAATEQLVTDQVNLLVKEYGEEGQQIVAELQAYADGANAYREANGPNPVPISVNDVIATTAFIGSIFGAGGGREQNNADFLAQLINGLGDGQAQLAWEDVMLFGDPEAPTSTDDPFDYGPLTGGDVIGSAVIDAGSIVSLDPIEFGASQTLVTATNAIINSASEFKEPRRASNWLIADGNQSRNGSTLAVMGPQLGYYYPEIVMQIKLEGAGVKSQGAAVPGLSLYMLVGRTENYAWSLTSASNDVIDTFVEVLCNPDGSEPTRDSLHYEFNGECIPYEIFNAGTLNGNAVVYPKSVHGSMIGTATSNGLPVALTQQRSTFGRDGLNLVALKRMTEGAASNAEAFFDTANEFGFTFNWGYVSRNDTAFFSSGRLPVRATGLDRRLPTWGTGEYEWQGFLSQEAHPHDIGGPGGHLLNWNNKAAPGFMHGDDSPYGAIHRKSLLNRLPDAAELKDVVGVMNLSATQDIRSLGWVTISEVLRGDDAPSNLAEDVLDLLDDWVADNAPRLDADDDGFNDSAGPTIFDALWGPLGAAVVRPIFGDLTETVNGIRNLGGSPSSGGQTGPSNVEKEQRTQLGKEVRGPVNLQNIGGGSLPACRDSLWAVLDEVATDLASEYGNEDPASWLKPAQRVGFAPGLIPNTMRATNRPTFQQALEFAPL
ncbi:MAG: penicillin acylase family protein [Halioglobus sp.]|nr:penicillin acylase family protein [Halioglobus sp.]